MNPAGITLTKGIDRRHRSVCETARETARFVYRIWGNYMSTVKSPRRGDFRGTVNCRAATAQEAPMWQDYRLFSSESTVHPPFFSCHLSPRGRSLKRRQFIKSAVATTLAAPLVAASHVAAAPVAALAETAAIKPSRIVDTHTHFYDPTRPEGVPWPGKDSPLYRKVIPDDWRVVAKPHGVRETIVVEASPWVEDNQWILDLAANDRSILGLVGNLDPRDHHFAAHLTRFAKNPLFRGLRWRSDLVPIDRDSDALIVAAKRLVDLDLELDLNGPFQTLPLASRLAAAVPDLRIVINHLGGSGDPQAIHPQWRENIVEIAERPNVFMKVSALPEQVRREPGKSPAETEYYLPVLDHLWNCFGEDRLIYGSNWPVSDRGAPYDVVYKIVSEYFADKGTIASEKYFWSNSLAAYRWQERA